MSSLFILTTEACGRCRAVKEALTSKGIEFTEIDINIEPGKVIDLGLVEAFAEAVSQGIEMPVVIQDRKPVRWQDLVKGEQHEASRRDERVRNSSERG